MGRGEQREVLDPEAQYRDFVCSGMHLSLMVKLADVNTRTGSASRDAWGLHGDALEKTGRAEMQRLCRVAPARVSRAVMIPGLVESDFHRMRVPAPVIRVQPDGQECLLQIPLNLMAITKPITKRIQLLGIPVMIRARPQEFTWSVTDVGTGERDGESIVTSDPGQPYGVDQSVHVGHTFRWPGKYRLNLSTSFAGEYSLDGGDTWVPISGTVSTTSRPRDITAVEKRSYLINDPDDERPDPLG